MEKKKVKKVLPLLMAATVVFSGFSTAWAEEPSGEQGLGQANEVEMSGEPEVSTEPETSMEPEEPEISEEPETPTEPETPEVPTEPETPEEPEIPADPETPTKPEEPEISEEPETPTEPETPEGSTEPETPEEPEIPAEPETSTEPEEPEISEEPETPTVPEIPSEPDNGSDEETKPIAPSPSVPQTGWNPQVLPVTGNQKERFLEEFTPSERLIPKVLRIKYSTDMPLENIPPFITTEMITGALKVQDEYGYPASVTIAQVIQESGFGKYGPYGEKGQGLSYLAFQYNNLFGVKGTGPAGSVQMKTGEETEEGRSYTIRAGFRMYHTYSESMEDRAKLLKEVYSDLIEGVTDANTFAMRIGSRWATDVDYGKSLIRQMETYDLYRLDRMTLETFDSLLGEFADPCPGSQVTSRFGWRQWSHSYHKGIDLGTGSENIPTYAVAAGTVIEAGWGGSAGNWIIIDHGEGIVTKYMHHSEMYVKEGDRVEKGEQIGLSGTTGRSTGNHLHFQLEIDGEAIDPEPYLFPEESGLNSQD